MSNGYHLSEAIQTDRLPVYDPNDSGDVIFIRSRRMTFGESRKVNKTAMQMRVTAGQAPTGEFDAGEYQLALLLVSIVAWDGPTLQNVPINADTIDNLDGDFATRVLQAIDRVNESKKTNDPNPKAAGLDVLPS